MYVFSHMFINEWYLCGSILQKLIQVDASGEKGQVSGDRSGWETSEEPAPRKCIHRRNHHPHWNHLLHAGLRQVRGLGGKAEPTLTCSGL